MTRPLGTRSGPRAQFSRDFEAHKHIVILSVYICVLRRFTNNLNSRVTVDNANHHLLSLWGHYIECRREGPVSGYHLPSRSHSRQWRHKAHVRTHTFIFPRQRVASSDCVSVCICALPARNYVTFFNSSMLHRRTHRHVTALFYYMENRWPSASPTFVMHSGGGALWLCEIPAALRIMHIWCCATVFGCLFDLWEETITLDNKESSLT